MISVKCKTCGKSFPAKPSWVRNGGGKYCSARCHYKGLKTGKKVSCAICGKEIYRAKEKLARAKSKKYFCSKSCQTRWRNSTFIGKKHANWKDGRYAYRSILGRHKVPRVCGLCGTKDGRVLAVHHIDGSHHNNRLQNLAWLCHNCHFLVHHYPDEREKFMVPIV